MGACYPTQGCHARQDNAELPPYLYASQDGEDKHGYTLLKASDLVRNGSSSEIPFCVPTWPCNQDHLLALHYIEISGGLREPLQSRIYLMLAQLTAN